MTAPTRLGYVTATSSGAGAATVDLSPIPNGSWMVALFTVGAAVATGTPPAGWTMFCADQAQGSRMFRYGGKVKAAGDTSVSWASASGYKRLTVLWGAGADVVANWTHGLIGVRNAANVVAGQSVTAGSTTTSVAPSTNVTKAESLVLSLYSEATTATGGPAVITAGGSTLWFNVGDEATVIEQHSASYLLPAVGATLDQVATYSVMQGSNGLGVQLVIPPGAAPDLTGPGFPIYKGNRQPAKLYRMTAAGLRTPVDVAMVNTGYGNLGGMLNDYFWWAHRGGSASFPEHSMHAYTQSILRGYQALEISLNRTSDGVWFGLHDQNLDRTSKATTGFTDAAQMTWAQVQSYQNNIGPGGPQPYMKWDDLIAIYGSTHMLICDPKHRFQDRQNEFLDKCLSDIGTDRCIVKGFYDMVPLRTAAQSRGLQTWGYSYAASIDGDASWATKANGWDLQGMEYNVAQSYWDKVLVYGVPVVAHICPNEAAVTAAMNKGASGFQCSGTAVINPFPVII